MCSLNIYQSTRNKHLTCTPSEAILWGIAPDGGLYTLPLYHFDGFSWQKMLSLDSMEMATELLCLLLPGFSRDEMLSYVAKAYKNKFNSGILTPTVSVGDEFVLELFHGPTAAFKDIALCLLPHLMCAAAKKCNCKDKILILTATSGDTGSAALSGFCNVPNTHILVFYPLDGVSPIQKAQMITQEGDNVRVCAVQGNFDDTQSGVKHAFSAYAQKLSQHSVRLSSANSINIGRLIPQIVYYFSAYAALVRNKRIVLGQAVDFSVPTGNFGDILAGFIARELGLPIGHLICASNANNVLTEFLQTGYYNRCRPFHKTTSPSMDILVSSNLERLLYLLSEDEELVSSMMKQLSEAGHYQIPNALLVKIQRVFWAASCEDDEVAQTIANVWHDHRYLCDPHTAVAWYAAQAYKKQHPDHNPIVLLSTASPYKFPDTVLPAIGGKNDVDGFSAMAALEAITQIPAPEPLKSLEGKKPLHSDVISPASMDDYVLQYAEEIICKV